MPISRNMLFLFIGALIVAVAALGYEVYDDHRRPALDRPVRHLGRKEIGRLKRPFATTTQHDRPSPLLLKGRTPLRCRLATLETE